MSFFYSKWWKWLCVVLLFYVLMGNFFVSLGPGITKVEPSVFRTDSVYTFRITAYRAHFADAKAGKVQMWFKAGNKYYEPLTFNVTGNETAEAQFGVNTLQQAEGRLSQFDIVINDELDGTFALRDAATLVKTATPDSTKVMALVETEPEVKQNKHQLFCFPYREILYETIRNTFFHVPMWFVMTILVSISLFGSIACLMKVKDAARYDTLAHESIVVAMLFATCGYLTGLVWSKYTWYIGVSWGDVLRKLLLEDIKMAAALIAIFFYAAYLIIRGAITDENKRRSISAGYNIFAYVVFILCVFVIPRLTDSMHPGNGGNPAFSKYDMDNTLRLFFYPAIIGWILLGLWVLSIRMRIRFIEQKQSQ